MAKGQVSFKDVAHLYCNSNLPVQVMGTIFSHRGECETILGGIDTSTAIPVLLRVNAYYPNYESCTHSEWLWLAPDQIKPILRPLSDMTEPEMKEFVVIAREHLGEYEEITITEKHSIQLRVLAENKTKHVSHTTDIISLQHFSPAQFNWLLKNKFDLFRLLESESGKTS